jgi:hypothetical protein
MDLCGESLNCLAAALPPLEAGRLAFLSRGLLDALRETKPELDLSSCIGRNFSAHQLRAAPFRIREALPSAFELTGEALAYLVDAIAPLEAGRLAFLSRGWLEALRETRPDLDLTRMHRRFKPRQLRRAPFRLRGIAIDSIVIGEATNELASLSHLKCKFVPGYAAQGADLTKLTRLGELRRLDLDFAGPDLRDLVYVNSLAGLKLHALTIECFDCYGLPTIDPLRSGLALKQLRELRLNFSCSAFPGQLRDLSPIGDSLPELLWLEVLDLAASRWQTLSDLTPLRKLPPLLKQLALDFRFCGRLKDATPLDAAVAPLRLKHVIMNFSFCGRLQKVPVQLAHLPLRSLKINCTGCDSMSKPEITKVANLARLPCAPQIRTP